MIRRLLPLALVALLLLPLASVASAQTSGAPVVSLTSQYMVNGFGFAIVNETVVFQNNGTSTVQIPTIQVGIPDAVASHAAGWVLVSQQQFSQTSSDNGNVTTFTIVPSSATLGSGASVSVSLKSFLSNVFNITTPSNGPYSAAFLLRPSLNQKVTNLDSEVVLPSGGAITPVPGGYSEVSSGSGGLSVIYSNTTKNVTPVVDAPTLTFSDSSSTYWTPMQVYSVTATILPSANAVPQIEDAVSLRNMANYSISSIQLTLLAKGLSQVTAVPVRSPPTIDPTPVSMTGEVLSVTGPPYGATIVAGDNFTFGIQYAIPASYTSVSGTTISVSIPYILPIQAVVQNYTVELAPTSGISPVGPSSFHIAGASPLGQAPVVIKYSVSLGWAASQAVPIASLVFAIAFVGLGFRVRTRAGVEEEEEEEADELGGKLIEMIKAFENKIALFQQFETEMEGKTQGTVSRAEFGKIRNEMDALRVKATARLNEMRQTAGSQKYVGLLSRLQDASRDEDRAAKDLLNLYDQYQSRRMRDETFKRLLPNYKKRSDSAVNHLSDLLNLAQREGKQG